MYIDVALPELQSNNKIEDIHCPLIYYWIYNIFPEYFKGLPLCTIIRDIQQLNL